MKYNPIGSHFFEGNVELIVKPSPHNRSICKGCWYNSWEDHHKVYPYSCNVHGHVCTPTYRKDRKHVIFEKV